MPACLQSLTVASFKALSWHWERLANQTQVIEAVQAPQVRKLEHRELQLVGFCVQSYDSSGTASCGKQTGCNGGTVVGRGVVVAGAVVVGEGRTVVPFLVEVSSIAVAVVVVVAGTSVTLVVATVVIVVVVVSGIGKQYLHSAEISH